MLLISCEVCGSAALGGAGWWFLSDGFVDGFVDGISSWHSLRSWFDDDLCRVRCRLSAHHPHRTPALLKKIAAIPSIAGLRQPAAQAAVARPRHQQRPPAGDGPRELGGWTPGVGAHPESAAQRSSDTNAVFDHELDSRRTASCDIRRQEPAALRSTPPCKLHAR